MFIFPKFLSLKFFWANLFQNSEVGAVVHCYLLIMILMFIFRKFLSLMFFGQIWFQIWISSNWLKFRRGMHCYMLIAALMFIFSKFFLFIFLGKFGPKIWSSSNCRKFGQISFHLHLVFSILTELHRISLLNFTKFTEQQILE